MAQINKSLLLEAADTIRSLMVRPSIHDYSYCVYCHADNDWQNLHHTPNCKGMKLVNELEKEAQGGTDKQEAV